MDNKLRERYYQVFRTTNALVKLEYSDLMRIMDESGLDDKFCEDFVAKQEAWAKDTRAQFALLEPKIKQMPEEQQRAAVAQFKERVERTIPAVPEQNVDIFQRGMLEAIQAEADLQLLNTL